MKQPPSGHQQPAWAAVQYDVSILPGSCVQECGRRLSLVRSSTQKVVDFITLTDGHFFETCDYNRALKTNRALKHSGACAISSLLSPLLKNSCRIKMI